ncbi:hypothetical protein AVEN_127921-1 [Araneus ventricosus]|uniref:Uncharacterized protein n=1 Tax=Araneus ventricosus TaxID=182803 RepID=A0A4Y2A0V5_ARAVE|nr:hypothetical protein AVEN_127921-1 [Araneus ventricosus]
MREVFHALKSYLRNNMCQERLSALAVLKIENTIDIDFIKDGNRKTESPRPAVASGILNDSGRNDRSSTEAGGPRPDPSRRMYILLLVEGLGGPPLLCPQGRRVPAYLSSSNSYPCTRGVPRGSCRAGNRFQN